MARPTAGAHRLTDRGQPTSNVTGRLSIPVDMTTAPRNTAANATDFVADTRKTATNVPTTVTDPRNTGRGRGSTVAEVRNTVVGVRDTFAA
jgi:hypothetical protein